MNVRRIFITFFLLLFFSLAAGSSVFFWQTRQEYNRLQKTETLAKLKLAEKQQHLREQELVVERLRTDPTYVETIIRRRLGYAKPDEMIYRFDP